MVRAWVLARARDLGETLAEDGPTPLSMAGTAALWLLRLVLAPKSTLAGFRDWVVTDCPVAPGLRPGHAAQLEAERRAADEQVTMAIGQRDDAVGRAAAQADQARGEADRARAAEAEIRGELDRVRADAQQAVTRALADAARERDELRGWAGTAGRRHARRACAGPADASRLVEQVRDDAAGRIASPGSRPRRAARGTGPAGRGPSRRRPPARPGAGPARGGRAQRARRDGPAKRDRMIELAGQRRDLATMPLGEVSKLASAVAAEIGYSPGTARRELVRHVRELQAASRETRPEDGQ